MCLVSSEALGPYTVNHSRYKSPKDTVLVRQQKRCTEAQVASSGVT